MHSHRGMFAALGTIIAVGVVAVACGGSQQGSTAGGGLPDGMKLASGEAALSVSLSQRTSRSPDEIWVRVERVVAYVRPGGWITLSSTPTDVNLLELQDKEAQLGLRAMPAGKVTQLRLVVARSGNYVVKSGKKQPLTVASGIESGIMVVGPWEVAACAITDVTLDFDGNRSLFYVSGTWYLSPVILVNKHGMTQVSCASTPPPVVPDAGTTDPVPDAGTTDPVPDAGTTDPVPDAGTTDPVPDAGTTDPAPPPPAAGSVGMACTRGSECMSGTCDATKHCGLGSIEADCLAPTDCLSGLCSAALLCEAGGAGVPCRVDLDCVSGTCGLDNRCAAGSAGGAGAACTDGTQCLSNDCLSGTCQPGAQGSLCNAATDCANALACTAGSCTP